MKTDKRFWIGLSIFILAITIVCFFPYLFTSRSWFGLDFSGTGGVGDTISGIMSPFIGIAAALLTFFAFWVQYQANVQQRQQFLEQLAKQKKDEEQRDKIWRIERFENRFYELLRLHRANVDEMRIGQKLQGRRCFVQMFYEFKQVYITVDKTVKKVKEEKKIEFSSSFDQLEFAYKIFFYGIGHNSEKQLRFSFDKQQTELFQIIKQEFVDLQDGFTVLEMADENAASYLLVPEIEGQGTFEISYFPFDGHVNRLGHYYRHLFQTATYVVSQKDLLTQDEMYSYIKTLRAQLSNHEQLLLYYNAVAWFDSQWRELFTTFRLIKNLPLPSADFGPDPKKYFAKEIKVLSKQGKAMFEWME